MLIKVSASDEAPADNNYEFGFVSIKDDTDAATYGTAINNAPVVEISDAPFKFVGTYITTDADNGIAVGDWFFNAGSIWHSTGTAALKATRAVFKNAETAQNAKIGGLSFDDIPLAIDGIAADNNTQTETDGAIFNLAGQRVDSNYRGVVIKNGRKFIQK